MQNSVEIRGFILDLNSSEWQKENQDFTIVFTVFKRGTSKEEDLSQNVRTAEISTGQFRYSNKAFDEELIMLPEFVFKVGCRQLIHITKHFVTVFNT